MLGRVAEPERCTRPLEVDWGKSGCVKPDCCILEFTAPSNVNGFSETIVVAVLGVSSGDTLLPLPEEVYEPTLIWCWNLIS